MYTLFGFLSFLSDLQRRGSFPLWLAITLGIIATILVGVLYVREAGRIGVVPRMAMALVRMTIVLLIAFLLLRPVWVKEEKTEKPRPVAVLIDVSMSMANADPRPNLADQWRAAMAFGLYDIDKSLPDTPSGLADIRDKLPEKPEKGELGRSALTNPQRIAVARAALTNPKVNLLSRLAKTAGALEVYTFGTQRTVRTAGTDDWVKNIEATEPSTALVTAAFDLINRDDADAPAAIVLVTDGRDNVGPKSLDALARECKRRGIPIYAYGVGSTAFGQLQTAFGATTEKGADSRVGTDVPIPNTLFVDDIAAIPVRYTVKGIASGTARVVLKYGDRDVTPEDLKKDERFTLTPEEMREGKTFSKVIKFVPGKVDAENPKQEYSATVTITSDTGTETLIQEISRPAQVVNRKLKVLVIDSLPRRDFQFLQRDLLRDRRVEAKFYLTEGDKAAMRSGPPWMIDFTRELNGSLALDKEEFRRALLEFDLLILGDVPGKYFTDEQKEVIKEFVTDGGGLIQIAGRWHAPADWAAEKAILDEQNKNLPKDKQKTHPLLDLLPVEVGVERFPIQALENPSPFVPVLATGAARTQIVSLEDDPLDNAERWGKPGTPAGAPSEKQLRPMYWFYPVLKTRAAADVFLTHPTARTPAPNDKPTPLLAGHFYGKGYVLFVGFDDTWRWRFNNQNKYSGRFWTQAVYTAGVPRVVGTRQTQLSSSTPTPISGTSGQIYLRAFDEKFKPLTDSEITGTLELLSRADGKEVEPSERSVPVKFLKVPGTEGEYRASIAYDTAGQFRLTVNPKNSPATLNFPVYFPENDERARIPFDEPALQSLCAESGGKFYREETLSKLPDDVKPQTTTLTSRVEMLLWNKWAMMLLIALLTLEWFIRKFNGLS